MAKVLLVEDDGATRLLLGRVLEDAGHQVLATPSAERALRFLETMSLDILLTDVGLGGVLDGLSLAREVKERSPATKILLFSGTPVEDLPLVGDEPLCLTIKQKPLNLGEILAWIAAQQ